ncbi:melanization protease 1-like isoform X2 [Periplaneta americana]|uniref:melanization protease 1-like isoform X2 n=1 Tax=Periplaneta americana TaxID=6978 RepID=UPI0037E8412F
MKFLVLAVLLASAAAQEGDSCTTPDNRSGKCINLRACTVLLNLLSQAPRPLPPDLVNFLRQAQCGFSGNNPLVCCASTTASTTSQSTPEKPPDVSNHPNLRLLPLNICGPVLIKRIIDGKKTELFQYPWMALIGYFRTGSSNRVYRCGGTVINEKYVLTAAHCIVQLPSSLRLAGVRLGEHDLSTDIDCLTNEEGEELCAQPPVDYDVEDAIPHPNYSAVTLHNDIGLIRIKGTANFRSETVKPICLPLGTDQTQNLDGRNLIVAGWGTTEKGISSDVLLEVPVPIMTVAECADKYNRSSASYKRPITITNSQICAGGVNAQDSCDGDSGGPLIYKGEVNLRPRFVQYGIVSFGPRSCGLKQFPGVYTRVAFYMDWILSSMRP